MKYFATQTVEHFEGDVPEEWASTYFNITDMVGVEASELACYTDEPIEYEVDGDGVALLTHSQEDMGQDDTGTEMGYVVSLKFMPDFEAEGGFISLTTEGVEARLTWLKVAEGVLELQDQEGNKAQVTRHSVVREIPTEEVVESYFRVSVMEFIGDYLESNEAEVQSWLGKLNSEEDEDKIGEVWEEIISTLIEGQVIEGRKLTPEDVSGSLAIRLLEYK